MTSPQVAYGQLQPSSMPPGGIPVTMPAPPGIVPGGGSMQYVMVSPQQQTMPYGGQLSMTDRAQAALPERFRKKDGEEMAYGQHCLMCFLCGGMWLPCFIAAETCGICRRPCG